MVICKTHNFIFLRIPKNASTSLAAFFVKNFCTNDDIYTYIGNAQVGSNNIDPRVVQRYKQDHRIIHMTLNEIVDESVIDPDFVMESDVIGVMRNPLERQLSLFFFLSKEFKLNNTSVAEFRKQFKNGCHASDPNNAITQSEYLKLGDDMVGSFWLYENVADELNKFVTEKGVKINDPLRNYKSNYRNRRDDALIDEYYDEATRRAVEDYYAEDMEIYRRLKGED